MATGTTTVGFEEQLWQAADKLRSNMDAAEYKHVVLGLIFLKYVSDSGTDDPKKITSALLTSWAEKHVSTILRVIQYLKDSTEDGVSIDEDLFLGTALALLLTAAFGLKALLLRLLGSNTLSLKAGFFLGLAGSFDLRRTGLKDGLQLLAHDGHIGILERR